MQTVWHFLNSSGGGVAHYVEQLVKAQAALQELPAHRLTVTGPPELRLPESVRHHHYQPDPRAWGLNQWRFAASSAWQISRPPRRGRGIVHAHNYTLAAPHVYTAHGLYDEYRRRLFAQSGRRRSLRDIAQFHALRMLERRILTTASRVVFVSTQNRCYVEDVMGIRRDKHFQVILPGVDTDRYHPNRRHDLAEQRRHHFPDLDATGRWLMFVGHDFAGKGFLRLLPALTVEHSPARWQLLVFGDDPQNGHAARRQARALGVEGIHFLGSDPRLPVAFGVSDCLLLPSIAEGFPLVMLEAMASGCVPVVLGFGGVSDVIVDHENGCIAPDVAAMARIAVSMENEQLLSLSHRAVATAQRRTWHDVAADYAACYAELNVLR